MSELGSRVSDGVFGGAGDPNAENRSCEHPHSDREDR
jgi:hypothetical protein